MDFFISFVLALTILFYLCLFIIPFLLVIYLIKKILSK